MTTEFTHLISMLVPQQHWQLAGDLVAVISGQKADRQHFQAAIFAPDFAACNHSAKAAHVQALLAAKAGQYMPQRPAWDINAEIDLEAVMQLISDSQVVTNVDEGLTLTPGVVVFGIGVDAATMAAAFGLSRIAE